MGKACRIAIRVASHFVIALALLIGCPVAIMVTWRITKLFHMIRRLRLRTISPHPLREKLRNGGTIALLDLLNFEEAGAAVEGIPGAVRIAPARLRIRDKVYAQGCRSCFVLFFTSGIYKRSRGTRSSASRYRERIRTRRWAQCLKGRGVSRYNGSQLIY